MKIQRALISVYNKEGVVEFAKKLRDLKIEIISSGGTARLLKKNDIEVTEISEYTKSPEMMSGRVKTLHPKIFGGILARRDVDQKEMEENDILPIDLVVVNLYPFEETIQKKDVELKEVIENIDIGGPSLIRAAAKNYNFTTVVVDPKDYDSVVESLEKNDASISDDIRAKLAVKSFSHTARYDSLINEYFRNIYTPGEYPEVLDLTFKKVDDMRYGENPHQTGALYSELMRKEASVCFSKQLHGKQLSFNNILDVNEAFELVKDFKEPTVA
ncbi:bifunctional phosphoribosylaminoimidazolecarboxamide formyltransferase/IMP cyclohydrolase, partial [Nanoarchaeota archaeon]